ncbi:MAG: amidohydrolase family protein, partial [Pseudomonadota bacterium]
LIGTDDIEGAGFAPILTQLRRTKGAVLGAFVKAFPEDQAALPARLKRFMEVAEAEGFAVDFHVDETLDPASRGLELVAEAALATGHQGPILCGHGCALSRYEPDRLARTTEKVAKAGIGVVSLPLCNAYLQDRAPGETPRLRGPAPIHELHAAGVAVALGSDNTRDPFHAYGDLDLLELYRTATLLQHLDHPVGDWPAAITTTPARLTGLEGGELRPGAPADLVITPARDWSELIARPVTRLVLRGGQATGAVPPDFCDLDDLEGMADASDL